MSTDRIPDAYGEEAEHAGKPSLRAYICDDAPSMRALVRLTLEEDPTIEIVGEAGDAPTAIAEVATLQPNVVVLDLSMPGMDGLEALPEIKQRSSSTCVIVFSGFNADRMAGVALAHGADHYISKGEELTKLRDTVLHCGSPALRAA